MRLRNACSFAVLAAFVAGYSRADEVPTAAPGDLTERPELWTCGSEEWGPELATFAAVPRAEDADVEGSHCLALNNATGAERYLAFPKGRDAGWDLRRAEAISFRVKMQRGTSFRLANPRLFLRSREGPFVLYEPQGVEPLSTDGDGAWRSFRVPLAGSAQWRKVRWLEADLSRVDFLEISFSGGQMPHGVAHTVWVDSVRLHPDARPYKPADDEAGDLDVVVIEREPLYERYTVDYAPTSEDAKVRVGRATNANARHEPAPREWVTWRARVVNKGRRPLSGRYRWTLDGAEVAGGDLPALASRAETTSSFRWRFDPADHDVRFEVVPGGADYCAENDGLTVRTNALSLKFSIERGLVARMESRVGALGSRSAEDWIQAQVRFMNLLFRRSVYDFAPEGITQRVAVGTIEYVEDGKLVTLGGGPFRVGELDPRYDGGRGLTALDDPWKSGAGAPSFLNFLGRPAGAWLHELSHQIGVMDHYQFAVEPDANEVNGVALRYARPGLMGGGEIAPHVALENLLNLYAPADVAGLNATKGRRRGWYGEYLYQLPRTTDLRLVDDRLRPVADAEIAIYQTRERRIDAIPEQEVRSDGDGRLRLENKRVGPYTTATGCTLRDNPFGAIDVVGSNGVLLVVARRDGRELHGFVTVADLHVAWARGGRENATILVGLREKTGASVWTDPLAASR
jgi:hypothetical protein